CVASARKVEVCEAHPDTPSAPAADLARPAFRTVTMFELVNAELPPRQSLLAPWLYEQGLAQVHAWRGTGKTHFSLGVAYAVASGGTFLRWGAPKPRRVLFLDGEMPAVALKERLAAVLAADDRDVDVNGENLRFITPDLLEGAPPDLADAEDQAALQDIIAQYDPALIVVDNISTLVRSGGAENDAESWLPVQGWALNMRRQGRAVLFVHHSGKGGRQRGTSKREDVLDTVIALKRPEPYNPADGARFIVEFEKGRHVKGDGAQAFEAHLTADVHGRQVWATKTLDDSTLDRTIALYRDGLTGVRDIAAELGVAPSTVSRALKKAKAAGTIEPERVI
ncbi:MAG: AAA family ATPase, partial [Casimicrobiaceae bacterium]